MLINLTNDGWFWGSSILDLQLDCAVLRAVELRRPFLVAANTGFSAWIDGTAECWLRASPCDRDRAGRSRSGRAMEWLRSLGRRARCRSVPVLPGGGRIALLRRVWRARPSAAARPTA